MTPVLAACVVFLCVVRSDARSTAQEELHVLRELDDTLAQISHDLTQSDAVHTSPDTRYEMRPVTKRLYPYYKCPPAMIPCNGKGRLCVGYKQLCNGRVDCISGWDEKKDVCAKYKSSLASKEGKRAFAPSQLEEAWFPEKRRTNCGYGLVSCGAGPNSRCIPPNFLCDGYVDCYDDGWDEDPHNCVDITCPAGMVKCNGTSRCISRYDTCNDVADCQDGEDESIQTCGRKRCDASTTRCPDVNICVTNDFWCDGEDDCGNGGDERVDACMEVPCDGKRCSNGRCLHTKHYCDGIPDCSDGGDEDIEKCGPVTCPKDTIQCGMSNYCFHDWVSCDGHEDCPNGEDEEQENCVIIAKEPGWYPYMYKKTNEDLDDILDTLNELVQN